VDDVPVGDLPPTHPPEGGRSPEAPGERPPRPFSRSGTGRSDPVPVSRGPAGNAGGSIPPALWKEPAL